MTSPLHVKIHSRWLVLALASVMLTLSACGGGSTGATWFNLPSIPVKVQPDGSAKILGINLGPVVPADQLQQLQATNVQKLEVRPGYEGLFIYANGETLPSIEWDESSMGVLGEVVQNLPAEYGVPGGQVAQLLPALRKIGFGVSIDVPPGEGQEKMTIPAWSGNSPIEASADAGESPLGGPINIGSLAFNESGEATMEGVPLAAFGVAGAAMPPALMQIFKNMGAEKLGVKTTPTGIDLSLGDKALPRIAYNADSLGRTLGVAAPLLGDQELVGTLEQALPMLATTDLNLDVSLTGEPASVTTLPKVGVEVGDDGSLSAFGMPVGEFPPDLLAQLQDAGVQQLDVDISDNRILLAANKEKLPMIQMSDSFLDTFMNDIAPALEMGLGDAAAGGEILQKLMDGTPIQAEVKLPGSENVAAGEIDTTLVGPDPELLPAVIHAELTYGADGMLSGINTLGGSDIGALAESFPELPSQIGDLLDGMDASELQLVTGENAFNVNVDGENLIALQYDVPSLVNALKLAGPFLEGTPLENPDMIAFLESTILPYAPGSDIDLKIKVE